MNKIPTLEELLEQLTDHATILKHKDHWLILTAFKRIEHKNLYIALWECVYGQRDT